ncbi:efflux RND transporter periplasmic adaptor subunit [Rhodoferax sp. BAB1]|uniref:efflux RND transporter periplasmic adaptor subunit n=1 Tax=Rhodoferax sp. BAB1 TaxID=2741720 RepID=UPI001575786F|nr:efflux RND transporter periplasmic adaptor subunit [Rhodoferax sp. BAB1]QKO20818.1 efflux RND transporter periplasmic adaptor subunit [Rhodoferax sp. BAB1]
MKRQIKWVLVGLVVTLLAIAVLRALGARKAQQAALTEQTARATQTVIELAASDLLPLQMQELTRGLPVSGTLKAANTAYVKARVPGELQGLSVREGDAVQAGQVIARIDPAEYEARLRQAQLQADAAKAQIDIAQRQYDNNKALVDRGFISTTALDTSLSNLNAARANHAAALAAADVARKSMADTTLKAPMSGFVSQRLAQPGERVALDARIVEIVDLSRMEIEAALSAADTAGVRVGQQALLQVEGHAQPVPARVARINPSTQAGSRSVLVYLQLKSVPGLRQGLFVQGTLGTEKLKTLAVPLQAVRSDKPQPYIQVVENQQVRHVSVTLGARGQAGGQDMVAISGLPAGSLVLASTVGPLQEGTAVRTTPAAPAVQGR